MLTLKCRGFVWLAGVALFLVGCTGPLAPQSPGNLGAPLRSLWWNGQDDQDGLRKAVEASDFPSAAESGIDA
jgi:hypothetical protein